MRLAVILLILAIASPAEAAKFRWFWEAPSAHRRHHHEPPKPPDCTQINDGLKMMDADHFDKAWCQSTRAQQEIVANCSTQERVAKCSTIKP